LVGLLVFFLLWLLLAICIAASWADDQLEIDLINSLKDSEPPLTPYPSHPPTGGVSGESATRS
jgi:hypothetical protein